MDILIKTTQNSSDYKAIIINSVELKTDLALIHLYRSTIDISIMCSNLSLSQTNLIHYIANNFDQCFEEFQANPNYILKKDVDGDWYSHSINSESILFKQESDKVVASEKDKATLIKKESTVIDIEGLTEENIERMDYMFNNICIGITNSRLRNPVYKLYSKEGIDAIDSFIEDVRERFFPIGKLDSICAEQIQQLAIKYFSAIKGKDDDIKNAYVNRLSALASIWWDNNATLYNVKGFDEKLYQDDLCFLYYNNNTEVEGSTDSGSLNDTLEIDKEAMELFKKHLMNTSPLCSDKDILLYKSDLICGKENSPTVKTDSDVYIEEGLQFNYCRIHESETLYTISKIEDDEVVITWKNNGSVNYYLKDVRKYFKEGTWIPYNKPQSADLLGNKPCSETDVVVSLENINTTMKTEYGDMTLLGIVGSGGEEVYFEDKWGFIIKLNYREVDGLTMNGEGDIITVKEGLVIPKYTPPFKSEEVKLWQELRKQKVYEWWLECPFAFIVMNSKEGKSCIQDITRLYIEDSMVN